MTNYVGRFAPSPSGPLHFGSLVAAVASFCDARAHHGKWLVRIEDIDTPRCQVGADIAILECLHKHGLYWDGDVVYQSQRLDLYYSYVERLGQLSKLYWCTCTRKRLKALGGEYDGFCRQKQNSEHNAALRVQINTNETIFHDELQGEQHSQSELCDPIIIRRDGLFAYNLVVVADDIEQGITHIVRGSDILPVTPLQRNFYRLLRTPAPAYLHIPVASAAPGRKLSKQNHAPALNNALAAQNILSALRYLGQPPPETGLTLTLEQIINHAVDHWQRQNVPKCMEVIVAE